MATNTRLQEVRKSRGLAAADLAQRVGVSRQTIYAIEDGSFVPNTTVSLLLARVLDVKVEDLFSISDELAHAPITAELLDTDSRPSEGQPVRYCNVGSRRIGIPVPLLPPFLPASDGIVQSHTGRSISIRSSIGESEYSKRLLIAGCDPALSVIADMLSPSGIEIICVSSTSRCGLNWLAQGKVHAAGLHLRDRASGDYNIPFIRRQFSQDAVRVVTFAVWEQGLVVQRGNPKGIRSIADLAANGLIIVNREKGSGSRDLLDRGLQEAGVPKDRVAGYEITAPGHLSASYAVAIGTADCCIASRSASRCFGLDLIPLAVDRFDLSFSKEALELPPAKAVLDLLNRATLRNKLKAIAGYDTTHTGELLM